MQYPGRLRLLPPHARRRRRSARRARCCSPEPTFPGCHVMVRAVAVFWMSDEKGADAKVLCVPSHDPRWNDVRDLADVDAHLLAEIEHFFEFYKTIEPGKDTTTRGWEGADAGRGRDRRGEGRLSADDRAGAERRRTRPRWCARPTRWRVPLGPGAPADVPARARRARRLGAARGVRRAAPRPLRAVHEAGRALLQRLLRSRRAAAASTRAPTIEFVPADFRRFVTIAEQLRAAGR